MLRRRRAALGFSLVELMVALALGLAVTTLVGRVWMNNRQSFRNQDNRARILENGRFALQLLERELRLAGYKGLNREGAEMSMMFGVAGVNQPVLTGANEVYSVNVAAGPPAIALTSDTISVAFYGASNSVGAADDTVTNCFGVAVPSDTQVQDTFSVQFDTVHGLPALMCSSTLSGSVAKAVAYSIESLQILYGEETDGKGTGSPNHYVQAQKVVDFNNVRQVRVSLLARGEDRTVVVNQGQSSSMATVGTTAPYGVKYYHFGTTYGTTDSDSGALSDLSKVSDGRQRALFSTTIALRNP